MENIKSIDEFLKPLIEAYETSLEIEWKKNLLGIEGFFEVKDLKYKIISEYIPNNFMTFKFKYKKDNEYSDKLLNSEDNYKISVIPTIKSGIEYILNEIEPNGVIFAALDESKGRKLIYDRFANNYINNDKWKVYSKLYDNKKLWIVYKKDIDIETIFDVVKYCGDNFIDTI